MKTMKIEGPGIYRTRRGDLATILSRRIFSRRWNGKIERVYAMTWWYENGKHNSFECDDIVALAGEEKQ